MLRTALIVVVLFVVYMFLGYTNSEMYLENSTMTEQDTEDVLLWIEEQTLINRRLYK